MLKDFINWIQRKIFLHTQNRVIPFTEREIWWCDIGINLGYEIDGKNKTFNRPVLIVRKFNHRQFWGLPLTTKQPKNNLYSFEIKTNKGKSFAAMSQLRCLDVSRLSTPLVKNYKLPENDFEQITNKLVEILTKKSPPFGGSSDKVH